MSESMNLDQLFDDAGPAALVVHDELVPVEGPDGIFFPPTYAVGDGFPGGYNIDGDPNGTNVCLVDSVGSQANRIEPLFGRAPYSALIPQIEIRAGERVVNLLEAGHRGGDAIVRCSALQGELQSAFKALLKGNALPLAKISPTSLVFGVWDSRDTQAKAPRLIASVVRAFDVRRLTRSAQYVPAIEYVNEGLLDEPKDKATRESYSQRGFIHVPATGSHGGVIAKGGIRRQVVFSLSALRLLSAGDDVEQTRILLRYLLGISLTAFTWNMSGYLRQGCNLVLNASSPQPRRIEEVWPSGERKVFKLSHEDALAYATKSAKAFAVGESRKVDFDQERARRDLVGEDKKAKAKKGKP